MRRFLLLAALIAASPAGAQTVALTLPNYTNAIGNPRGVALSYDPSNAPFSVALGPLAAATDYSAQGFRAVNVTCSATGSATLTLIGGGSVPITFATGASYQLGFAVASISAVPSGCIFHGLR